MCYSFAFGPSSPHILTFFTLLLDCLCNNNVNLTIGLVNNSGCLCFSDISYLQNEDIENSDEGERLSSLHFKQTFVFYKKKIARITNICRLN